MYSKEVLECRAFGMDVVVTRFFKDGIEVAIKRNNEPIRFTRQYHEPLEFTRAQGFRYWKKGFKGRPCYVLPQILQDAIDKEAEFKVVIGDCAYYG